HRPSGNAMWPLAPSPGRPAGIDRDGYAMHGVGVLAGEIDSRSRQLRRLQEVAARRSQGAHLRNIGAHVGTTQMGVERRRDVARRERVDVDVVLADFDCERAGEVSESALRGAIGRAIWTRADAPDRRHVDHLAAPLTPELRQAGLSEEEGAL